ncbi:expressed unknown protein [Seminavis robusta]|uniref:Uncharacterized protein n=1 Tax=Seminavis robusta TaxID=568900 RepID=A0A9N8DVX8_9STRA|nr:expressed unknown protein [Seminavis robusta]|eukprot:Sro334_g119890.1 n/a (592) ;mRNA; f:58724-60499
MEEQDNGSNSGTLDDSAILWSDDPEKDYLEYMLKLEREQRASRGKSAEDSLVGDDTIAEILRAGPSGVTVPSIDDDNNDLTTMEGFSLTTPNQQTAQDQSPPRRPPSSWERLGGNTQQQQQQQQQPVKDYSLIATGFPSDESSDAKASKTMKEAPGKYSNQHPSVIYVADRSPPTPQTLFSKNSWQESSLESSDKAPDGMVELRRKLPYVVTLLSCIVIGSLVVAICLSHFLTKAGAPDHSAINSRVDRTGVFGVGNDKDDRLDATAMPTFSPYPSYEQTSKPTQVSTSAPSLSPTATVLCGCPYCTSDVLSAEVAFAFTCHDRLQLLMEEFMLTESAACNKVTSEEYPTLCSPELCDPAQCQLMMEEDFDTSQPQQSTGTPSTQSPTLPVTPEPSTLSPTTLPPSLRPTLPPTTLPPSLRPTTGSPTNSPSLRPSTLSLTFQGNSENRLQPLGRCEGDCDSDDDCGEGLICYQRGKRDPVPGCLRGEREKSATDFCVPEDATLAPTTAKPSRRPTLPPTQRPTTKWPTITPVPQTNAPTSWRVLGNPPPTSDGREVVNWMPTLIPTVVEENDGIFSVPSLACGILGLFCG